MTDYFALLDQPRAPWLDPNELKETYHRKTLRAHPDAQGPDAGDDAFARLNEAYQVLQDPKRRLHHLLSLEGHGPSAGDQTVPSELHDLFPAVGAVAQRANLLLDKIRSASNALSRSLLKPQILEIQEEVTEVRQRVQSLTDASFDRLRQINPAWATSPTEQIEALSHLYFAFAYLTRWSKQLDEMTFQLSLH